MEQPEPGMLFSMLKALEEQGGIPRLDMKLASKYSSEDSESDSPSPPPSKFPSPSESPPASPRKSDAGWSAVFTLKFFKPEGVVMMVILTFIG
jgi:hypothetical protein